MRPVLTRGVRAVIERLAIGVTGRRALVVVPTLVITVLLGFQIPNLEADPTPERLLASYDDDSGQNPFSETFAQTEDVLVVLLEGKDILDRANLQYMHNLARSFEQASWASAVRSLTTMRLPRFEKPGGSDEELTLDDLDGGGGSEGDGPDEPTLDDLEGGEEELTLDDLEDEPASDEGMAGDPKKLDALSALVDAAPDKFPSGLGGLAAKLEGQLRTDPVVAGEKVTEADVEELERVLSTSQMLEGRLVSKDRDVAVVALELSSDGDRHATVQAATRAIQKYLADHPPPDGTELHLGGLPHLRNTIVDKMRDDRQLLMPLTILVCLIILYLAYRWLAGTILPVAAVGITAIVVMGGMAVTGQQMNVLTNIIPPLLVIIGICESIHLVGRYREELVHSDDRDEAGRRTVRTMSVACFLASLTTAVGLGSLVVSGSVMLRNFGMIAAAGVMVAYVVTVTFLPAALSAVPTPANVNRTERRGLEQAVVLLTRGVLRQPWLVLAATAVLLAGSVYGASKMRVDHALLDQFDESDPVYETTMLMEEHLGGIRPLEVRLSATDEERFYQPQTLSKVDQVAEWAESRSEVIRATGPSHVLHETWALLTDDPSTRDETFSSQKQIDALVTLLSQREQSPISGFLANGGQEARLSLKLKDVGAKATLQFIDDLEVELQKRFGAESRVSFSFSGDAYRGSRSLRAVVTDLLSSLLMAIGIIFLLMTLLLRSVRLGLLSIPSNVIPLVVTMAYMVVREIPLNAATVIIFSISIGLAVDSTIHVLARYREETLGGLGSNEALIRAARGTGQAIVVSNLTLMAGFMVLTMSSFVPVRNFGELIAITVGGCLVATLVVQPALLKIAGLPRRAELEAASL